MSRSRRYRQSYVCNLTGSQDGRLFFSECPYRDRCWKYNPFDPSAIVKAWKDFSECKNHRRFALKELRKPLEEKENEQET